MSKITVKTVVDTEKLRNEKPGEIQDRSIVVMSDGQKDSYYDDPTKNNYQDKLHSFFDMGDKVEWTIEALNGKDDVEFTAVKGDDLTKLFDKKPEKEKGKKKWKTHIKTGLKVKTKTWYTFSFTYEGETYFWDPTGESRHP